MKTKLILAVGALMTLGACDESKYDLENLVPKDYHKIIYINNSGATDLTLYNTGEDNTHKLSIFKGGSEPELTAGAKVGVLSQVGVDSLYSIPEGVNYKVLGSDCYSFDTQELNFKSEERYKNVIVSINVPNVEKVIAENPDATCVLPVYLYSETDSINGSKDKAFLKIAQVLTPTVGFASTEVVFHTHNVGFGTAAVEIDFGLDTDNKWDIDCTFAIDPAYVDEYNAKHGTSFIALPLENFSFEEKMTLAGGVTTEKLKVTITEEGLIPVDYMLPIRLAEVSMFTVSETKSLHPLVLRVVGTEFNRSNWGIKANTEEKTGEGAGNGVATCLIDGNINSFWHSQWSAGSLNLPHEIEVDVKEIVTFSHIGLLQRQHAQYKDVKSGEFFVSSDGNTWTSVGTYEAQQVYENQIFPITPTKGRYFKIVVRESYRGQNSAMAEVYAYGTK